MSAVYPAKSAGFCQHRCCYIVINDMEECLKSFLELGFPVNMFVLNSLNHSVFHSLTQALTGLMFLFVQADVLFR